jgi:predicted dehydrogenase
MDSAIVRVAVIGSGIFVRETYIPNILANSTRSKLTAILSRSVESVEEAVALLNEQGKDVLKFSGADGEEMFFAQAKDICDAVIIVVPIPLLGKYVERCLDLHLHILSEKPIAMTSGEGERLLSLYRARRPLSGGGQGGLWHVAENYRLESAAKYAGELVRQHVCEPKSFTLLALRQQSTTSKFAVTPWRATPQYKGSFVLDGGIHFVALLRAILGGDVRDIKAIYEEMTVVEVGSCGCCRVGSALGTFQIKYGAFPAVVCRLDIYWDDATMNVIQHKGIGYEVRMTGEETRHFGFDGLQTEFAVWLDSFGIPESDRGASRGVTEAEDLTPEQALVDLRIVEKMCGGD